MKEEYNQLIALFGSLDKDEQEAVLKDLTKIAEDGKEKRNKAYLATMESVIGHTVVNKSRARESVCARAVVAYVMAQDGYSEQDIGHILKVDHSTAHYYKGLVKNALSVPNVYRDLITLYNKYTKLL